MTRCPYCQRIANPLRYFIYRSSKGYRCRHCGKSSEFRIRALRWLGGISGGVGGYTASVHTRINDGWENFSSFIPVILGLTLTTMGIQFFFFRLFKKEDLYAPQKQAWDGLSAPKIKIPTPPEKRPTRQPLP